MPKHSCLMIKKHNIQSKLIINCFTK